MGCSCEGYNWTKTPVGGRDAYEDINTPILMFVRPRNGFARQ